MRFPFWLGLYILRRFSAVTMSFCWIRFFSRLDVLGVSLEEDFLFPCHVASPTHLVVIFFLISWCAHMSIRLLLHSRLISFAISFFLCVHPFVQQLPHSLSL